MSKKLVFVRVISSEGAEENVTLGGGVFYSLDDLRLGSQNVNHVKLLDVRERIYIRGGTRHVCRSI